MTKNNLLKDKFPGLYKEIDIDKNIEMGIKFENITYGSNKKIWWLCETCNSKYDMPPKQRSKGQNCPYCRGYRINSTNSLKSINPLLANEWHPTRNGKLTSSDVTSGCREKVWWLGRCGHEWEARVSRRKQGDGCPYCVHNGKTLQGFNDMFTTHPQIAAMLLNVNDGYNFSIGSDKKLEWKCPVCSNIVCKQPDIVHKRGLSCPRCSDGFSIGEKIVYSVLSMLQVDFITECIFEWSNKKRYDFYIPSKKMIIEVHGGQHYFQKGFSNLGGRTLKEEQSNDAYKSLLAQENGIANYVVINASSSDPRHIKKSIQQELSPFFNLQDIKWDDVYYYSQLSIIAPIVESFLKTRNVAITAQILKRQENTIKNYLQKAYKLQMITKEEMSHV